MPRAQLPVVAVAAFLTTVGPVLAGVPVPVITGVVPDSGPTSGGTAITISGTDFGTVVETVTVGGSNADITSWADTMIEATTPPGVGLDQPVQVINANGSSNTVGFSYDGPMVFAIVPPSGPTQGGTPVTIMGTSFGASPASLTIGGASAGITSWNHTQIMALTPPGMGLNKAVVVTTASGTSNSNVTFNYDGPMVTEIVPSSGPTGGGTPITVSGTNFGGSPGSLTIGGRPAQPPINWSHSQITANTPPGVGVGQPVVVTTDSGGSNTDVTFDYDGPAVSQIAPSSGSTEGGTPITVSGANFGPEPGSLTIGGAAASIDVWGQTQITGQTPPGVGLDRPVVVFTASGVSNADITFDYDAPSVTGITPGFGPTAGGTPITVNGANFGPGVGSVTIGGAAASIDVWGQTQITGQTPPGMGLDQPVVVTTLSGGSNTNVTFDYNPPTVIDIAPSNGPTPGGTPITVNGSSFGAGPGTLTIGGVPVGIAAWGHSQITALTPAGVGLDRPVVVTTASGASNVNITFDYDGPLLSQITPSSGPPASQTPITVEGLNFGPSPGSLTIGGAAAIIDMWEHSQIDARTPSECGSGQTVVVTTASGVSNTLIFDYVPSHLPGDMNCDCAIADGDVPGFVTALVNPGGFVGCDITLADMNGDTLRDARDVQGFVEALLGL